MSYCRWSSDNFQCDLYIYEDVFGGWTIHVASRRTDPKAVIPEVPPFSEETAQEWLKAYRAHMDAIHAADLIPIGLPHDGAHFNEPTREATLDRVRELRGLGYRCPDHVEERLLAEIEEVRTPS